MLSSERLNSEKMEIRMKGRIAELEKANQALRAELLERAHSEETLRRSEEKYRTLFNSVDEGFFLIEVIFNSKEKPVDCHILEANQSQKKVTGIHDVAGKQIRKLFPHKGEDWTNRFGQVALTGDSIRFEERVESVSRWFEVYASRIGDEHSRKVSVLFKDITESKKAEETLLNERARLQAIIHTIPVGFLIIEASGQISVENEEAKRILRGTILLERVSDYVRYKGYWPETGEQLKTKDWPASQALLYGRNILGLEIDIERFDGTRGTALFSAAPIKEIYGTTIGAVVILQDVTERKRVERSLHSACEEIHVQAEDLEAQTEELQVANEALYKSEKRFELLSEANALLLSSDESENVIQTIAEKVMRHLNCNVFFNYVFDEVQDRLHLNACSGVSAEAAKEIEWLSEGDNKSIWRCVARNNCLIFTRDLQNKIGSQDDLIQSTWIQACSTQQLRIGKKTIGKLFFGTKSFKEDELALMSTVANKISIAVERKRVEKALRKSEEISRQRLEEIENLYRNAPVGLCELDRELRYVRINERLAEINGLPVTAHIGKRIQDVLPLLSNASEPEMLKVLETGKPRLNVEIFGETLANPGVKRSWLQQCLPITDATGLVTGLNVVIEETTEQKRAEEELFKAYEDIQIKSEELCKINEELKAQSEELKVTNEALSESERRFRTLAENSPDMIVRLDRKKRIRYANPAFAEIYGRYPKEVMGKTPGELGRYYGHLNFREKYYEKVLTTGKTETVEFQYISSQGKKYYFNTKIVPEFIDCKVISVLEISRDITEQKKVEKELKLARDYNRSLIEANLDPLVTIGHDGKITDTNTATELITGYSRDELIGTDFSDYFTEPERAREGYQYVFQQGLVRDYSLEIQHKEGHVTPVLYNASVYRNETGEINGVFAAAHDITEIKKAKENIQSLANIVESSNDAIITESLDGIITSWNRGAEQIYGYQAEEVLGKSTSILEPDDLKGEIKKLSDNIKLGKNVRHHETLRLRKDGTKVNISVTLSPVFDVSGKLVAISNIAGDITEKKIAENLLYEKEIAEAANLTKSEFLANMSHELRTPLNSIIGFSDMLYEQVYGELNKRQLRAVANVSGSGKHLLNLINGILDLSKIEAKKMELDYREFELVARLNLIRNILLPIADKKNVRIELDIDNRLTRICADEDKFVRIMYNLVDNAIKFSYENGFVNIEARKKRDMVEITVKDNGIGIRPEDQHKLFKPFSQVDTFSSKKFQGTGLGLSLVKQIVHLHGGYVWFRSNPGEGSTFAFVIPIIADVKIHAFCH